MRLNERDRVIDVLHQGVPGMIGATLLRLDSGIAVIDPGPEACMDTLVQGIEDLGHSLADLRAILLTHIHLDHAAATGALVREAPRARVHVHPAGATHMADPHRLLASAERIYGAKMDALWGRFLAVPELSLVTVTQGDVVTLGNRHFQVADVPGHAKHHVAFYEAATGTAWVGDVGGIRIGGGPPLPVTPPPDIDVELWKHSMDRVMAWEPRRIVPTHFGAYDDVDDHFGELARQLDRWSRWVRDSLSPLAAWPFLRDPAGPADDQAQAREFCAWVWDRLCDELGHEVAKQYAFASGLQDSWHGLARYWRQRELRRSDNGG